jgi:hypothetical protein
LLHTNQPAAPETFVELKDWLSVLDNKSSAEPYGWYFSTLDGQNDDVARCADGSKELAGLVSTNASTYLPGPPVFDKATQSLDYKVLAPHFTKDGSVFQGSYDLMINTKVAKCIYGFGNTPIKATISVSSADGSAQVATTLFSQDDKYLKLAAYGFTFSDPTLRVVLKQDPPPAPPTPPTPVVSNTTKSAAKKLTTITCVKGKVSTKVTAAIPKCPSGYKKK